MTSGDTEQKARVLQKLRRELGRVILQELEDPRTVEIMLNPDGRLWVEKLGSAMQEIGVIERPAAESMLATLAAHLDTVINRDAPILEGELPIYGARFEGVTAPISRFPCFAIRKKATAVFSLQQYVDQEIMNSWQRDALQEAIVDRQNILIAGGTGSGKTTLANALIAAMTELTPDDRIIILEDTPEIQCSAKNVITMRTSERISLQRLLRVTMRLRPDRILVGETRGGEALDLLKAWNTGHPGGLATAHANSGPAGLTRLEQLISEVSITPMQRLIAEAVNVVVGISKHGRKRRVDGIYRVLGFDNGRYITEPIGTQQYGVPFLDSTHCQTIPVGE